MDGEIVLFPGEMMGERGGGGVGGQGGEEYAVEVDGVKGR